MRQALRDARETQRAADRVAEQCAEMVAGRLRKVSQHELRKLKRELQDFNATTGQWKS